MKQFSAFIFTVLAAALLFTITQQTDLLAATPFSDISSPDNTDVFQESMHMTHGTTDALAPHHEPNTAGVWIQSNVDGFDNPDVPYTLVLASHQGYLYAGTDSRAGGANRLMRSTDGLEWEEVIGNGTGRIYNYAIGDLVEFQGKFYAGTWHWNWDDEVSDGGEVWRSDDGLAWTPVVTGGFGIPSNNGISRLIVFDDQLYAFTGTFTEGGQMQLWRTATGNSGDWQQVSGGPFANPDNFQAATLEIFQNRLYLGTANAATGGELWRSLDGSSWEKITLDGLGGAKTSAIAALESFDGQLFFSTRNLDEGGEIWRSTDGVSWSRAAAGGFSNLNNGRLYNLTNWNSQLYVLAGNTETGAEVWQSSDGLAWNKLSDGGWGDSNNTMGNFDGTVAAFNGHLYFGVTNEETGTELWRYIPDGAAHQVFLPLSMR